MVGLLLWTLIFGLFMGGWFVYVWYLVRLEPTLLRAWNARSNGQIIKLETELLEVSGATRRMIVESARLLETSTTAARCIVELQTENDRLLKERDQFGSQCSEAMTGWNRFENESIRLREALKPTEDDIRTLSSDMELRTVLQEVRDGGSESRLWHAVRTAYLAIIRERAGMDKFVEEN